jgi:hypothetical protein
MGRSDGAALPRRSRSWLRTIEGVTKLHTCFQPRRIHGRPVSYLVVVLTRRRELEHRDVASLQPLPSGAGKVARAGLSTRALLAQCPSGSSA